MYFEFRIIQEFRERGYLIEFNGMKLNLSFIINPLHHLVYFLLILLHCGIKHLILDIPYRCIKVIQC